MPPGWRQRRQLERALERCTEPTLKRWLEGARELAIGTAADTPILAVDLELTGLDPQRAGIVSVGWTEIRQGRLRLGANRHFLVRGEDEVGHSATIHEIRDQDRREGVELATALEALFEAAVGHLLLFHFAGLDVPCLQRACARWGGCSPPLPTLDTLRLEAERRSRRGQPIPDGALRLGTLREGYALPRHTLHDALGDAVATAELFLAMASHAGGNRPLALKPLVRWL